MEYHKCEVFEVNFAVAEVCCGRRLIVTHNYAVVANEVAVRVLNFQVIDLADKRYSSFYNALDGNWPIK